MPRLTALLVASLLVACSSQSSTAPAESPGKSAEPSVADAPPEEGHDDPNTKPGGEPPADCDFKVKETCYKDQDAACKAAGCEPEKCIVLESYPAQIQCG